MILLGDRHSNQIETLSGLFKMIAQICAETYKLLQKNMIISLPSREISQIQLPNKKDSLTCKFYFMVSKAVKIFVGILNEGHKEMEHSYINQDGSTI